MNNIYKTIARTEATAGQSWYSPSECRLEAVCLQGSTGIDYREITAQEIDDIWEG